MATLVHGERLAQLADNKSARHLRCGWITYQANNSAPHPRFEDFAEHAAPDVSLPTTNPDDPATILFTSGSTGSPKGVTHSFAGLGWMFSSAAKGFEYTRADVALPGSSLSHLGGIVFSFAALAIGARVVVARTFDGQEILPLLRNHRPTVLCMLPAALIMLVRDHGATSADFSSLRLCHAGGDKVPAEFEKEFTALTGRVIDEGYGMTEIGHAAMNPPSGRIKEGSIGRPTPGFTFSLRDSNGAEVAEGNDGQLFMQSRSQMIGYWADPEATATVLRDGWIDSGDVMTADADGYHWFRGRKKQIIVHDGSNTCPQEVEDALGDYPGVAFVGAVGIHDLVHGENVRAYVTFKEGEPVPAIPELVRFARERIGYKAPEEIVVLESMPFTATGKVNRTALKQMAEDRAHRRSQAVPTQT